MDIRFRPMQIEELAMVLEWAAEEGWNPGLDDAEAFHGTDPEGFIIAEVDGQPAAAISVVNHGKDFAFLGLYICRPHLRGRGVGLALWNHAIERAGSRTIGLDGVPAQQENYRKSGFSGSGSTMRFEGKIEPGPHPAIRPVRTSDMGALVELDAEANGFRKDRFLAAWLRDTPNRKTVVLEGDDGLEGFATIRRCGRGAKIGPIIASGAQVAFRLIAAAAAELPASPLIVDVPQSNPELARMLSDAGFEVSFSTARMYRGAAPPAGSRHQAVATLELG